MRGCAVVLSKENLTVEFHGQLLSRYDVTYIPGTDRLREVKSPTLFETPYVCYLRAATFRARRYGVVEGSEGR